MVEQGTHKPLVGSSTLPPGSLSQSNSSSNSTFFRARNAAACFYRSPFSRAAKRFWPATVKDRLRVRGRGRGRLKKGNQTYGTPNSPVIYGGQVQRPGAGKRLRLVLSMSGFSDPNCFQAAPFKDRGRGRVRLRGRALLTLILRQ